MTTRYSPSLRDGWVAFVAGDCALLLGGDPDASAIDSAWSALGEGAAALLELLTSRGLQATPPFALVEPAAPGVRAIVRGDVEVAVGAELLSGAGAATWIERVMAAGDVRARVTEAVGLELTLPLENGVALAASVTITASAVLPSSAGAPPMTLAEAPSVGAGGEPPTTESTPAIHVAPVVVPVPAAAQLEQTMDTTSAALSGDPRPTGDSVDSAASVRAEGDSDYDYLFGATMFRSVAEAAIREEPADSEQGAAAATQDGDHDGATMLVSSLPRGRKRQHAATAESATTTTLVAAVVVALPNGVREVLDEPLVFGRAPSVAGVPGGQVPRLVTLSGGDNDISRSHLRVELEGDTVVVTDLNSKNGTRVTLPGGAPVRLRAGEPTPVIVGTVVDVGGVVDLTVENA